MSYLIIILAESELIFFKMVKTLFLRQKYTYL